jgi:mannose-1-phosphate guanylyltransferase / mannose-6-phosphate isomerase
MKGEDMLYTVILSGGIGSRLWPVSRKFFPKPFIKLSNGLSILQNTYLRALELSPKGVLNITSNEFLFKIQSEWNEIKTQQTSNIKSEFILEPFGRNTAAAIAMTSIYLKEREEEEGMILVLPSDHLISDQVAFKQAVNQAIELASNGKLVTFGMNPSAPETGFGYIEYEGTTVKRFVEKPSIEKAIEYLSSGKFLWNSGMFCFKPSTMLEDMAIHCPDILEQAQACYEVSNFSKENMVYLEDKSFAKIREESIDYALIEKSNRVAVVPCDIGWSDIGNWTAVSQMLTSDEQGNVVNGQVIAEKTQNCYIEGNARVIGTLGLDNLIIVDTPDALLVANKNNAQDVKQIYKRLAKSGHQAHEVHTRVFRPWGSYTVLEENKNFKIKRIVVNPGASLSLQSHEHRSEHWVVVSGQAKVINGERQLLLNTNESTYISAGNKHRLSNPSDTEFLSIIEVQTGNYLGEDDIIRYEDIYNRVTVG